MLEFLKKKPKTESCRGLWAESFNFRKKWDLIEKWKIVVIEHLVLLVLSRFQNYMFFAELDEDTICFFIDKKKNLE
jgi:hypothetical protein